MFGKIKSLIVRSLKKLLPKRIYFRIRNFYQLTAFDPADLRALLELNRRNYSRFDDVMEGFERTKQRTIIMDGKLNYLLYGKATDHSGTVDQGLIKNSVSKEKLDHLVSFTTFLRGSVESLRTRYHHRLEYMVEHGFFHSGEFVGKSYVDLGAGNGYVTEMFQKKLNFGSVCGVDSFCTFFEPEGLRGNRYIQADVMSFTSMTTEKFDFITAIHLVEHLQVIDQYYFFKKLKDMLNANGVAFIEMPNTLNFRTLADLFWADEQHIRPYPLSAIRALVESLGFESFFGVFDSNNTAIAVDDYTSRNEFFTNEYQDLFIILRKK
tara:strand:+ start:54021 stop:54986 length:966 start_codon:yes stop_codon:yes gene_type:complete